MKNKTLLLLLFLLFPAIAVCNISKKDSLLIELDKTISKRSKYTQKKIEYINELKRQKAKLNDLKEQFDINTEIISQYSTFICDSAEFYINQNLSIAKRLNDKDLILETSLRLFNIYSLSGLFLQANEISNTMNFDELADHFKVGYCWNYIRYYENLIFYTADHDFTIQYEKEKEDCRDKLMAILSTYGQTEEYDKELAHKLQLEGKYSEALDLSESIFNKQNPQTHHYAMAAMNLAKIYKQINDVEKTEYYLILAAITDIQLAVKENEALLSLAIILYDKGDINRAYDYIRVALDDALFYNTRFKNSVIARVQPIIEDTYLQKIKYQQRNLKIYSMLISLLVIILGISLLYIYKQIKVVSKARKDLRKANIELLDLNQKLDEANIIKEKYLGYFMNLCSVYINKLHSYKKNTYIKIKSGQIESVIKSLSGDLEKDADELRANFDKVFLKLYPNFLSEFNSLLKPGERFELEAGELNTEIRIFALIKLGITDVNQIADFLRYSVQTVYNYKSKVKGKSLIDSDLFENEVKKLGKLR